MVMSVIMSDAAKMLGGRDMQLYAERDLAELLYADDTLLLSIDAPCLGRYLAAVSACGAKFGLELHAGKYQLLQVLCDSPVKRPDGTVIAPAEQMVYLGTMVSSDGRIAQELARRLGMASAEFRTLARVFKHSGLSHQRKLQVFHAMVLTKLLYGLCTGWLNTAERRRLDGFQNRCLRTIWGIKPAFISRISNKEVLSRTGQRPLSEHLLVEQLFSYGKVARSPDGNLLRSVTFCPGSRRPATDRFV